MCRGVWRRVQTEGKRTDRGGGGKWGGKEEEEDCKREQSGDSYFPELEGSPQILPNTPGSGGSERSSNLLKVPQLNIGLRKERRATKRDSGPRQVRGGSCSQTAKATPSLWGWPYAGVVGTEGRNLLGTHTMPTSRLGPFLTDRLLFLDCS